MALNLGIDYGTTTTQVSFMKSGGIPSLVEIGSGAGYEKYSIRSVIAVDPSGTRPIVIGDEAYLEQGRTVIPSLKRCLGCSHDKMTGQGVCYNAPNLGLCAGLGKYCFGQKTYTVDNLVESFFLEVFDRALDKKEDHFRVIELKTACLRFSVPPVHTSEVRRRLREAIKKSFLVDPDEVVNEEPVSALATLYRENRLADGLHLVCDIGGGTTDTAMIHIKDQQIYLLKTDSLAVGGNDFDECLFQYLRPRISENKMADHHLRRECRVLKERLSSSDMSSVEGVSISRKQFNSFVSEPVERIISFLRNYIITQIRRLPADQTQEYVKVQIHLAGGGSLVPIVKERLENLGLEAIRIEVKPIRSESTTLFGEDLAIFAIALGNLFDTDNFNLLSLPVEIECIRNGERVILARTNSPFPVEFSLPFFSGSFQLIGRKGAQTYDLLDSIPHTPPITSSGVHLYGKPKLAQVLKLGSCKFRFRSGGLFFVSITGRREIWFQAPWSDKFDEHSMKLDLHDLRKTEGYSYTPDL